MTQSIFITGASSGIGALTAQRFLEGGWRVGLFARRAAALEEVAAGHPQAEIFAGDVTDAEALTAAIQSFGVPHLDVLFANAGIFTPQAAFDEVDPADWRRAVDVNLSGMFYACRAAFGVMRHQVPQGGRILLNGSISATSPREGAAPYTATKHGVTGLCRQIALDGRPYRIACGQIDVGNARTELLEGIIAQAEAAGQEAPPTMDVAHVPEALWHMANLPLEANIHQMTLMATQMPYVGRG